ncbi:MAG: AAA family ATPase [Ignavibacteriaceae bacterium]|nr:AAA family ATPase [Ignavibacteriaceae bacterium]
MNKIIPLTATSNFEDFISSGYYYVDKTGFIPQLEQKASKYLFSVPEDSGNHSSFQCLNIITEFSTGISSGSSSAGSLFIHRRSQTEILTIRWGFISAALRPAGLKIYYPPS